ncbi:MAG: nitrite reductase small subunit NirD [Bacteroidota bacterium]
MEQTLETYTTMHQNEITQWFKACAVADIPENGGACVKYQDKQIAIFNYTRKKKWYACQNLCPHKMEMVLSRGMLGDAEGVAKVACPLHKKTFSLEDGTNLNGDLPAITTYPLKIEAGFVYLGFSE